MCAVYYYYEGDINPSVKGFFFFKKKAEKLQLILSTLGKLRNQKVQTVCHGSDRANAVYK